MRIEKRQQVKNLREIWPTEMGFSDWLASSDGIELIAEDIGIAIEDPKRERRVGDFPCDIVARLVGDEDHVVVIENQFNKTDHDHLGKLITYAAVNEAFTAIWVSEKVSDDHRKAIDWLNDNTPPQVSFYLVQVKAFHIGDSPVAPQLDVVSRPNLAVKVRKENLPDELKERHEWRKSLWGEILTYIESQNPPFNLQSPGIGHWSSIALGRSNFALALTLTPKRQCVGCELYFQVPWKKDAIAQLWTQKDEIEAEIGSPLQWQSLEGKKAARIVLEARINPRDPENLQAVKEWMSLQSVNFYRTFKPRVAQLSATSDLPSLVED